MTTISGGLAHNSLIFRIFGGILAVSLSYLVAIYIQRGRRGTIHRAGGTTTVLETPLSSVVGAAHAADEQQQRISIHDFEQGLGTCLYTRVVFDCAFRDGPGS